MPSSSKRPISSDDSDMEIFPPNFRPPSFESDDDVFGTTAQGASSGNKSKPASPSNKKKAPVTPRKSVTRPDASSSSPKTPTKKARNSNPSSSAPLTVWSGEQDTILMKRIAELCISQRSFFYETPGLEGWKGNGGSAINSKLKQLLTRAGKAVVGVDHLPDEFIEKKPGAGRAGGSSNNNTPRQNHTTSPSPINEPAETARPRPRPRITLPPTPPTPLGSPAGSECDHSPVATSGFPWAPQETAVGEAAAGPSSLRGPMRSIMLEDLLKEGAEVFDDEDEADEVQEDKVRTRLSKQGGGLDDAIELSD